MNGKTAILAVALLGTAGCADGDEISSKTGASTADEPGPGSTAQDGGLAMNECDLHTGFAGDENCILPPPPDQGFQIHVGPKDYDNPDELYVLNPTEEKTDEFMVVSDNAEDVFFFYRQYRLRPTAHHVILTVPNGSATTTTFDVLSGRRIGTANRSEDYPTGGVIAPEDRNVGLPIAARTTVGVSFHAINVGDTPEIREGWFNFWYRDRNEVTEPAVEWFKTGDQFFTVAPHESKTLGPYTCNVDQDGRLLWLYGHRHANNKRFTATLIRSGQREIIYDATKWEEPLLLEYSSLVRNPAPDVEHGIEGGHSGILDLLAGDTLEWQCDVVNEHDTTLRFTNQTYLGEMCIIDAEAVGSKCAGF